MNQVTKHVSDFLISVVEDKYEEIHNKIKHLIDVSKETLIQKLKTDEWFVGWFFCIFDEIVDSKLINELLVKDISYLNANDTICLINGKYVKIIYYPEEDKYFFEFVERKSKTIYYYE